MCSSQMNICHNETIYSKVMFTFTFLNSEYVRVFSTVDDFLLKVIRYLLRGGSIIDEVQIWTI